MKSISLRGAVAECARDIGRPVTSCGFEVREIGPHVVTTLYYKVEYPETGTYYRMKVWVDGKKMMGGVLSD